MQVHQFPHEIRLYNLGDVHRGNKTCNVARFRKTINAIKDDPHAYWVSTGDILEIATISSKSDSYTAMSPEEEAEAVCDETHEIADKCLGFTSSNHNDRIFKQVGLSMDTVLSNRLKIPFLGDSGIIGIVCGRCAYYVGLHHGVGGGSEGNKLNRAIKLSQNWLGLDVYLTGHTHTFDQTPDVQTIIDRKRRKMTKILSHHIITGHFLNYDGSYAQRLGLKEKPIGAAVVEFSYNESGNESFKKVRAWLSD